MFDNSKKDVYIALGSNIGDRLHYFTEASNLINSQIGQVVQKASIYQSAPVGFESENLFYNSALRCQSDLPPEEILEKLLFIEAQLGRKRLTEGHSDRTIDLDFLLYESFDYQYESKKLILPHPRMLDREFQLIPLLTIATEKVVQQIEHLKTKQKAEILSNISIDAVPFRF